MPRRTVAAPTPARASSNVSFRDTSLLPPVDSTYMDNLTNLRRQWRWAVFSQFFYTFAPLLAMPDVVLPDIEEDLARGTSVYLPRVMHRLLYTMSQDRKLSIDNWQAAFRKQCLKRGTAYNPLGPEPSIAEDGDPDDGALASEPDLRSNRASPDLPASPEVVSSTELPGLSKDATSVLSLNGAVENTGKAGSVALESSEQTNRNTFDPMNDAPSESRDWQELSMVQKLAALHFLTEWQFDNPYRLRQMMKDDGDSGLWRIEPIGYDAKTNAYWLIGPDRLWIQRVLPKPKPVRPTKRKRISQPKRQRVVPTVDVSTSEDEATTMKRTRTTNARTRSQNQQATSSQLVRGARAAKVRANKMLDAQAKEFAEYQRQAALLSATPERTSTRTTRSRRPDAETSSPPKKALGTRSSARLRGASQDDDDEWQRIPAEWLQDSPDEMGPSERPTRRTRGKGKAHERAVITEEGDESHLDDERVAQAGLGSDDVSELTELSDDQQEAESERLPAEVSKQLGKDTRSTVKGIKTATRSTELAENDKTVAGSDKDPALPCSALPNDFIEWETICVTLMEWETIAGRFANATHYLEKALQRVLVQDIVPGVTSELREVERKRKLEEALVHRKRSSRIALKEVEKEEARLAAVQRAEEEEKLARAKRSEARAKKEEAERAKREQAREQRRLEREERERKIQSRNEPKEPPRQSMEANDNSITTTDERRNSTSSHVQNHSVSNGARTPDWILECEVCGKHGRNMDDGLPMVCCGVCSRWQHIPCHDLADRKAGYPKRNWDVQQFLCQRCRAAQPQRLGNGHGYQTPARAGSLQQYDWSQTRPQKIVAATDVRHHQPSYDSTLPYGLQPPHVTSSMQSSSTYPRSSTGSTGIAFSHYQPEQHGFSRGMSSGQWSNGYQTIDNLAPRTAPITTPLPRYDEHSVYNTTRVSAPYQHQTASMPAQSYNRHHDLHSYTRGPDLQHYNHSRDAPSLSMPSASDQTLHDRNWNRHGERLYPQGPPQGQRSASHISAAESLAYMHEAMPDTRSWPNSSFPQQSHATSTHDARSPPVHTPVSIHRQPSVGSSSVGYQFPSVP